MNAPTLLQSGPLPLAIIFDRGGKLRIVDATADRLLSSVTVPPRCVVSLDASAGITVGSKKIQPGPLPPDHRYEIWWDP